MLFPNLKQLDAAQNIYELPPIPVLGLPAGPIKIRILDDSNLAASLTATGHTWLKTLHSQPRPEKPWINAWAGSDTGAFTLLVQPDLIKWPTLENQSDPVKELFKSARFAAIGASPDLKTFTLDLVAANETSLGRLAKVTEQFIEDVKDHVATEGTKQEFLADWIGVR